jgi:hypothetical protein
VDVLSKTAEILLEHIHLSDLNIFLHAEHLSDLVDCLKVFLFIKIGHITSIENIVDVLELELTYDLGINKQEGCLFVFGTSLEKSFFNIFTPVRHTVTLDNFDLEEFVSSTVCSKST